MSALNEDEDIKPILVPSLLEPSNIDEVFFTEKKSDLPLLCCTVFSCITQQNVPLNTTENDAEIAAAIEKTIGILNSLESLERVETANCRNSVPELKNISCLQIW